MAPNTDIERLKELSEKCETGRDSFVHGLPKIELHIHIEGTVSPELRWRLSQRNNIALRSERAGIEYQSLQQLKDAYIPGLLNSTAAATMPTFFELFDDGLLVLQTEQDFYELAMEYFTRCVEENVRYTEVFFGPHSHRHRGIAPETFMRGYQRAQREAELMGVRCRWIMLLNRQKPLEEAWENYKSVAIPYKDMVIGIGLAGNEVGKPPILFNDILTQARADGFHITAHCDVDVPNTHEHINQVLTTLGGYGADRCDHGLNIAESESLTKLAMETKMGLTICPWGYNIYIPDHPLWHSLRQLYDAGIRVTINSDDPPYMMGHYTEGNLVLTKVAGGFQDAEIWKLVRNSVDICWAPEALKKSLIEELESYAKHSLESYKPHI